MPGAPLVASLLLLAMSLLLVAMASNLRRSVGSENSTRKQSKSQTIWGASWNLELPLDDQCFINKKEPLVASLFLVRPGYRVGIIVTQKGSLRGNSAQNMLQLNGKRLCFTSRLKNSEPLSASRFSCGPGGRQLPIPGRKWVVFLLGDSCCQ